MFNIGTNLINKMKSNFGFFKPATHAEKKQASSFSPDLFKLANDLLKPVIFATLPIRAKAEDSDDSFESEAGIIVGLSAFVLLLGCWAYSVCRDARNREPGDVAYGQIDEESARIEAIHEMRVSDERAGLAI